jgi:catalase (peroxidase I)
MLDIIERAHTIRRLAAGLAMDEAEAETMALLAGNVAEAKVHRDAMRLYGEAEAEAHDVAVALALLARS